MRNKKVIYFLGTFLMLVFLIPVVFPPLHPRPRGKLQEKKIILEPPSEYKGTVNIWLERYDFSPEEELTINFSLSKRSYVYIYNIDSQGKVNLLFPNRFHKDNYLSAGTYSIPRKNYHLSVGETTGAQYLQALASNNPLDMLTERGSFSRHPFLPLGSNPVSLTKEVRSQLTGTGGFWSSDWIRFTVSEEKGWVYITSDPTNGRVYVEGSYRGKTPLTVRATAGESEIYIDLPGFSRWRRTVEVQSNRTIRVHGNLRRTGYREDRPTERPDTDVAIEVPLSSLGMVASLDSVSGEIIFDNGMGLGMGVGWPSPWPEMYDNDLPYSLSGGEFEFYGIYQTPVISNLLDLWVNGGVAVRVFKSQPLDSSSTADLRAQAHVEPDYKTSFFPFGGAGLAFRRESFSFRVGWGARRRFLFGLHLRF